MAIAEKTGVGEKRRHKRHNYQTRVEIESLTTKSRYKGASFDISTGGIRIVTNKELVGSEFIISLAGYKMKARLVHSETRESSMMDGVAYYYGFRFNQELTPETAKKLFKKS